MKRLAGGQLRTALALSLLLAACSSGSTPAPVFGPPAPPAIVQPPATIPTPPPRPGSPVMVADWTAPVAIALKCGGPGLQSPFACDLPPDAKWGVLPFDGVGGTDCVEPQPNTCFQPADGWLGFTSPPATGMALISATRLDHTKPMSLEAEVRVDTIDCTNIAYAGIVDYDGGHDDGDERGSYWAEYISCFPGDPEVKVWVYTGGGTPYAAALPVPVSLGEIHTLRIDWYPGERVLYWLDGKIILTIDAAWVAAHGGALDLESDPRPAWWAGSVTGSIGRFTAWGGD